MSSCLPRLDINIQVFSQARPLQVFSNTLRSVDGGFSYYGAQIKVYRYWPFGIVNLCLANKAPSAGEASDL
jgi:hypothetical protein